jgi:sulfur carrier protein
VEDGVNITINGAPAECADATTVAVLLQQRGQAQGVAVAINDDFVPRSQYATRALREGDAVEIVAPMQGG